MPTVRLEYGETLVSLGPTLMVQIGFDPSFRSENLMHPNLPQRQYPALVDTGATESCIDSALARDLGLPIVDRKVVAGIQGESEFNVHIAQIHISDLDYTIYGRFTGVHLNTGGQPHSSLIGRTFLRNFTMIYEGRTGTVIISND